MIRLNHLKDVLIGITQDTGKPSSAMAYGLALAAAAGAHASIFVASAPEFWPLDPLTAEAAVILGEDNARHAAAAAKPLPTHRAMRKPPVCPVPSN